MYLNHSKQQVEERQSIKIIDKKRSSIKSNWAGRAKYAQRNNNWNKASMNVNSSYSRNKSLKESSFKSWSVSKAENNYRAKKSKKPSQHTDKSNKQNWKNTLRQESITEAQRRKASNNYAVKRIKLTNERIKNMISEQYNRFKSDHPSMKLTYEDYVERLIDMNLISDNENKILSKSIKDWVYIIIMNTCELLICKKKTLHCIYNKVYKQNENVPEERLDTLNNTIYNSFVNGISK